MIVSTPVADGPAGPEFALPSADKGLGTAMEKRVYNFSPGPAVLPLPVIEAVQRDLIALPGTGISILEISHRSAAFGAIVESAEANFRKLYNLSDDYTVLFLQGGASMQFAMLPMNFLAGTGRTAEFVVSGTWSKKAASEAAKLGATRTLWDGKADNFVRKPAPSDVTVSGDAAYAYVCSNETIQGVQFPADAFPKSGDVQLFCDASSDIFCRPLDLSRFGVYFACAQKNAGPSGVTVVVMRKDLIERTPTTLPSMLSYRVMADEKSLFNTPPTFAIYVFKLITDWLLGEIGGLVEMEKINLRKAGYLYDAIDGSDGFYTCHADRAFRSTMNVAFRLPSDELQAAFLAGAKERDMVELKGHRSVGGCRASIYNAMPEAGVKILADWMTEFAAKNR